MNCTPFQATEIMINDKPVTGAKFTEGEFKDIEFVIMQVNLEEKDDHAVLHFEYDIINETSMVEDEVERFRKQVGDLIMCLLERGANEENEADGFGFVGGTE